MTWTTTTIPCETLDYEDYRMWVFVYPSNGLYHGVVRQVDTDVPDSEWDGNVMDSWGEDVEEVKADLLDYAKRDWKRRQPQPEQLGLPMS